MSISLSKIINEIFKKILNFFLVHFKQLFSADATMFSKKFRFFFFLPAKSWKNHRQKLLRKTQIHFFFLTASTAQMTQTEEFLFQNVAYRCQNIYLVPK